MSKKMLKSLAVVSVLTVSGAFVAHQAFATDDDKDSYGRYNQECGQMMGYGHGGRGGAGMMHGGSGMYGGPGGHMRGGMGMGLGMYGSFDLDRVLTEDQVRVMAHAGLIKFGNDNLKVGKITKLDNGNFEVNIVTKDNSLVNSVELDKATGMPTFMKDRAMRKFGFKQGNKGFPASDRTYTKSEIETLTNARLIRMGNENIKLDGVAKLKNGNYEVVIVTKDGSLVDKVEIDAHTGKPAMFAQMMQNRMDQRGPGNGPMKR